MTAASIFLVATAADGTVVQTALPPQLAPRVLAWLGLAAPALPPLSPREVDVLSGLAHGQSYKQIAAGNALSIDTIRTYVRTLYRKLGVNCVQEAVAIAIRSGLVA